MKPKVKKTGAYESEKKLNSNIGLDNAKYIININLQNDFRQYAQACKRLLKLSDTPGLIMIGCGRAITRLLKIASICSEYFPGLHMMNTFRYVKCRTCESKHFRTLNEQDESSVLANPVMNERIANFMKIHPQADGNWVPTEQISHKCRVSSTFPLLLVHVLRLSFDKSFVTRGATEAQIAIGYQKPYYGSEEDKMTFDDLVELYASTADEQDENRVKYPPKKTFKKVLPE